MALNMQEKKRKQIIFDVSQEVHTLIKVFSAKRNISMNNWMQRAINERIQKEIKYDKDNDGDL